MAQVMPLWHAVLSRARAFRWHGVALTFAARSRSGLRGDDGMIVFAMHAAAVRMDECGCVCPLWLPADRASEATLDRSVSEELLEHCRLAARHGMAEGFLLYGEAALAQVSPLLALRVVKAGEEYWARWGTVARPELPRQRVGDASVRLQ
jgi:hypothetical protein